MTVWIRIDGDAATVSDVAEPRRGATFATAIVEAHGALLTWDVTAGMRFPDAEIHSPIEAEGWLADVYGDGVAEAVRAGKQAELALPADAELVDAARALALLTWAHAWWPAGVYTPAVDPAIIAAEIAVAAHALEHVLDDPDAVERALTGAIDAPSALASAPASLRVEAGALADAIADLADDHGVELQPATLDARPEDWALAASGPNMPSHEGTEVGHGSSPVRWADVPAQTVAADSDAQWSLRSVGGAAHLHLTVAAASGASRDSTLRARFGPEDLDIDVPLALTGAAFTGSAEVAASVALLPLDDRTLWVRDPLVAAVPGPAESETDRDLVREFAVARLDDPSASLAERIAGARV
ncbi:hypothetical protein [Microbacterium murale]|uniref:Uncharacterized protein n=1 Tax=Microbacterium murale TaxID=1081040 RepID=A0ABU0P5N3_9MICO|nr:hypothetical protein [Microbacterium murale]MDQ0642625.1 hypothetical protein [Microbacterium murale]